MKAPPIILPLCAVPGCGELAMAKGKDGVPLCRKHLRLALRSRALTGLKKEAVDGPSRVG